jgi:hypothetical protein
VAEEWQPRVDELRSLIAEILGTFVAGDYDELARPRTVTSRVPFGKHAEWRERAGLPGAGTASGIKRQSGDEDKPAA